MMIDVLFDTNYLVGYHRSTDRHHPRSKLVNEVLDQVEKTPHVLDCIYSELVAVLARSYAEDGEPGEYIRVEKRLREKYWPRLVWVAYVGGEKFLKRAVDVSREAAEKFGVGISPHDAMLLLYAAEKKIPFIVSFDEQLGRVKTVEGKRLRLKVIDDRNRFELKTWPGKGP